MISQHTTLSLTLLFAAVSGGCLETDPGDDAEAADEAGRTRSALTLSRPEFRLSAIVTEGDNHGDGPFWDEALCDQWDDGVVRSWSLNEKNKYDFYWSRVYCREMNRYGTMGSDWDSIEHFFFADDGEFGRSAIPLDTLPVGVRLRYKENYLEGFFKVSDVALLYDQADDIMAGFSGYQQAPWAHGGRSGSTKTLTCNSGSVVVGIDVAANPNFYWTKAEVRRVRLRCKRLLRD